MARSGKLFGSTSKPVAPGISKTYAKATKVNSAGFASFERSLEEDTLSVLMTNTISATYYVSEKELAEQTVDILTRMADKDSEFLAKALVFARNKGLMRLAPIVGLAILSAHEKGKKVNFRRVFHHVIKTPDDLREFVTLCRTKEGEKAKFRALGGEARDAVKRWMQHLTEYHAVKYGSDNSEGVTLRDILRMSHPRPVNDSQRELFGWLVKGWNEIGTEPSPTNPQVWALEKIKRLDDDAEIAKVVTKYRLPWEVVVPSMKKMTPRIWAALLKDMPYMALLRNLNTMEKNGVFADDAVVKSVAEELSNADSVAHSKQLPFRFFNAYKAFKGGQLVRDALVDALEQSFVSVPKLPGKTCVANDVSGSMGSPISDRSETRFCDVAGLLAAALLKKCDDVTLLPFEMDVYDVQVSTRSTIMDIAEKIGLARGGTDLGAPIRRLLQTKKKVDTFIGITDCEDWAGRGFLTEWEAYKKFNPACKAFLVTITPRANFVAPTGYPDVHFVMGWNDSVLKFISMKLVTGTGQVEEIRKMDLNSLNTVVEK